MKRLPIIYFLLVVQTAFTQSVEADIKFIRSVFKEVNDYANTIQPAIIDANGLSAEGGELKVYERSGQVIKITAVHLGETGRLVADYYFHKGDLMFVFDQDYRYNRPFTWTKEVALANGDKEWYDPDKTSLQEDRYYYKKGKLIRWLNHEKIEMSESDPSFTNKQNDIAARARTALELYQWNAPGFDPIQYIRSQYKRITANCPGDKQQVIEQDFENSKEYIVGCDIDDNVALLSLLIEKNGKQDRKFHFYFDDQGQFVFCHALRHYYDEFGESYEVRENRYYFGFNQNMIKWLDHDKKEVSPSKGIFNNEEKEIKEWLHYTSEVYSTRKGN